MDTLVVNVLGAGLIAWIVWYFFLSRRAEQAAAAEASGVQEVHVRVKGGYIPERIMARPGVPLRIHFRREETSACSEEVVFPDFGIRRQLPAFETTVIEIPASTPGSYGFACGMDMMHGTLVLGEAAAEPDAMHEPPPGTHEPAPAPMPSPAPASAAIDPICGMSVDPARAVATSEREGRTVYFCSVGCKTRFDGGGAPPEHRVTLAVRPRR